jgi:hypothetical protein
LHALTCLTPSHTLSPCCRQMGGKRHKGIGMNKAKKAQVEGAARSAGGRPRKQPVDGPDPPPVGAVLAPAPTAVSALPLVPTENPTPTPPTTTTLAAARPAFEHTANHYSGFGFRDRRGRFWPKHPLHKFVHPKFLSHQQAMQRAQALRGYTNITCDCYALGVRAPGEGMRDDEHSMFCQTWHCYAAEVGCCGPEIACTAANPKMESYGECDCISDAFDLEYDYTDYSDGAIADRRRQYGRHVRHHVDEYGTPDRLGRGMMECAECSHPGGPYIPMCPWLEDTAGVPRGDHMYSMRGEVRGAWREGWCHG